MNWSRISQRRGDVSVETALLMPVVMGVIMLLVHFAAALHGAHVAEVAALRGAQTASRSVDRSTGTTVALHEMDSTVRDLQGRPADSMTLTIEGGKVRATVTLRYRGAVPWMTSRVTRTAIAPLEEFTFVGER